MKRFDFKQIYPSTIRETEVIAEKILEGYELICFVNENGNKLVLCKNSGTFATIGYVEYYEVFYGEKAGEFSYNANHTQYFPLTKSIEAASCFVDRLNSRDMFWYSDLHPGYTLDAIKQGIVT